jgi:DNA-binding transcriptional regulator GbsR (MarR family)
MKPKVTHRKLYPKRAPELAKLADQVGQFIEYWGFKSVQGRLWLYLFTSNEPLSSIELAELLDVSPALVTQSVQVLLEYKVILTAPKGPNGVLRYQANPDVAHAVHTVLESREARLLQNTELQLELAKQESVKANASGLSVNTQALDLIGNWLALSQMLLGAGLTSLSGGNSRESARD